MSKEITPEELGARKAVEITGNVPLRPRAQQLLVPALSARDYLHLLIEEEQYVDAIRLMPFTLPLRHSVWWACLCAEYALEIDIVPDPIDEEALRAAADWVLVPNRANQEAAKLASEEAGVRTAQGCAAKAAYLAGYAPAPDKPILPRVEVHALRISAAAALIGAPVVKQKPLSVNYLQCLEFGIQVASGAIPWFTQEERFGPDPISEAGAELTGAH